LVLDFLSQEAVGDYLAERFPNASFPPSFANVLSRHASGNPLFLVNVIDDLISRGRLRETHGHWELTVPADDIASTVPPTLREMVEKQVERLTPQEQAVLAAASVAGAEFSAVLAADAVDPEVAEECCDALARQGRFLRAMGAADWPDGTVSARYGFIHALYRNVLYARIPIGRRVGLHLRIGARLERAHGTRAAEIAGELAMHFEHGRDFERAVQYRRWAADAAFRRHAHREAADHATRALEGIATMPESPARIEQELAIQMILGAALITRGWASPEVAQTYARARQLCAQIGATPEIFPVLIGLFGFSITNLDIAGAQRLAEQMLEMASANDDSAIRLWANNAAGMVAFFTGETSVTLDHMEHALAIYDPARHSPHVLPSSWGGQDVGVTSAVQAAWVLWLRGSIDLAAVRMRDALARARALEHPYTLAFACHFIASFHACRGEVEAVRELEGEPIVRSTDHGIAMLSTLGAVHRAWLRVEDGTEPAGIDEMRAGIEAYRATGSGFGVPTFLALLADAYGKLGRPVEGLGVVAEARRLAQQSGAHYWDAELERLDGALTLRASKGGKAAEREAEARFVAAIDIANRQGAKLLALRAATALAGLWQRQGRTDEARSTLAEAYEGFSEGSTSRDLCEARALLDALAREHT
jgi:predicted ATPase